MNDDPQDIAARFWALLLGTEVSYEGPRLGSPLWGMHLVTGLAEDAGRTTAEVDEIAGEYLAGRWHYEYGDQEPPFERRR